MSVHLRHDINKTILGNSTAKSVLILIGDEANADGYGWPSPPYIASCTEVKLRTVVRMIQLLEEIGLISKVARTRNGRRLRYGIQISLKKLGSDLRVEFARAYARVQGNDKRRPVEGDRAVVDSDTEFQPCRSDADVDVAATGKSVVATQESVAATVPPDPLIGIPVTVPRTSHPPLPPSPWGGGTGPSFRLGLEAKQSIKLAVEQAMQACGFTACRLRKTLHAVVELEWDKGEHPPTTALAMIAAWKEYERATPLLRFTWGPAKFFNEGHWRKSDTWPIDNEVLRERRMQAEARVGSAP